MRQVFKEGYYIRLYFYIGRPISTNPCIYLELRTELAAQQLVYRHVQLACFVHLVSYLALNLDHVLAFEIPQRNINTSQRAHENWSSPVETEPI
jgi:hypothetical protein